MTLSHDLEPLVREGLPGAAGVEVLESVDSTNRLALDRVDAGAPQGWVVVADRQTAGRGRRGRTWSAEAGDALLLSMVVRPKAEPVRWEWLPLASAVAVSRSLEGVPSVAVKWPNDVLVSGLKVCGILAERRSGGPPPGTAVVGIGLNVNQEGFPPDLSASATSLRIATGRAWNRSEVARRLVRELVGALVAWEAWDGSLEHAYRARLSGVGRAISVRRFDGEEPIRGTFEGVDEGGLLLLRTGDRLTSFAAGDVTLREG